MPMSSHNTLMMLFSKLAPQSHKTLASALKIEMYPCHKNLARVFAVWSGVTYTTTCLVKWSQRTKAFTMCDGWSSSIIITILRKSTCSSPKGEVTKWFVAELWHVEYCFHSFWSLSASVLPGQAIRTGLAAGRVFATDPGAQHPHGIHSWLLLCELWGIWSTLFLPALQLEYGSDREHLGGMWISSNP